ncbi:phosphoglycerate dehydrogenase [Phycisphaera mikurensis]|uniref:D-3-phosphoglycerate dehydrogenase n=1 Tax=Phycisphaera mikurensis (strain NBRC 102666 / KCTC 22515 / FYK2301M01) TaxID=1142394 RepID=I0IBW3_PHYMF|nr:phosphoglycerate dehydrogenase [Phycisphaera mikurensis]MBB6442023.1 D-3-phosphoglycerate dehydrogenase [Phycisphaera mikurensis]BAM02751.1 D-3-phosphoglycerate dehydrogenase [Phycisphaera mikurensis NBRC 102666]
MPEASPKKTILAADKLAPEGLDWIRSQPDAELLEKPGLSEAEYAAILRGGGVHAMIVRSAITVSAGVLADPGDLAVIARAGVGVDNIDIPAATARGILVVNTAEASTITTAEHAFTLLASLLRNIAPAAASMREGQWDRSKFQGRQLHGMTLGVVGLGRIGRTVAERALAFGMKVVGHDPFVHADLQIDGHTVRTFRSFAELAPHADAVTFHVPKTAETTGMLDEASFALCRDGVFVVNASRGGIVDEQALVAALGSGKCGGAALDVYTSEPPPADSPLRSAPRLLLTPHLGASTQEAQTAVSVEAAKACMAYLRGEGISGAVNAGGVRVDLSPRQRAFVELAGKMATLLSPMITRGIAGVEVALDGDDLAPAAGTVERTVLVGLLQRHLASALNVINVADVAEKRGIRVTTRSSGGDPGGGKLTLTVHGPADAVDASTEAADRSRRIVGRVYADGAPRVVEVNGYAMDMVPAGAMVLIQNEDKPGIIGAVGTAFGSAGVNIADMTISRRSREGEHVATALMLLKLDAAAPAGLLADLEALPAVRKVAAVQV